MAGQGHRVIFNTLLIRIIITVYGLLILSENPSGPSLWTAVTQLPTLSWAICETDKQVTHTLTSM